MWSGEVPESPEETVPDQRAAHSTMRGVPRVEGGKERSCARRFHRLVCRTDERNATARSDQWVVSPTMAEAKLTARDSSK